MKAYIYVVEETTGRVFYYARLREARRHYRSYPEAVRIVRHTVILDKNLLCGLLRREEGDWIWSHGHVLIEGC